MHYIFYLLLYTCFVVHFITVNCVPSCLVFIGRPIHYYPVLGIILLLLLVHGQVAIIFVVSVCLSVCLFVQSFSQPSLIRFRSN